MERSGVKLYLGFDPREEVGYHTFCSSVLSRMTLPVTFAPLHLAALPFYQGGARDGTNAFIYSRFLIPFMESYKGWALFVDGCDMVAQADIAELWALRDYRCAVQVVKHDYRTKYQRKYVGTGMEAANDDYPRKNWSSVMLINCGHFAWRGITPETVEKAKGAYLHRFEFLPDGLIGELPKEWNWLADEYGDNPQAKLLHWTAGIPGFKAYENAPMAEAWRQERARIEAAA